MTAIREQIFDWITGQLAAIAGVQLVERMPSGDPDVFPALEIYDGSQRTAEVEVGSTRYILTVRVEGYVEGGDGADAHAAINELHAAVVAALMSAPPIGGLAEDIEEGDARFTVAELASRKRLGFSAAFSIQFATAFGDPSQPA